MIAYLKAHGLLDDRAYAEALVRRYRHRWGSLRLRPFLRQRGIPEPLIDELIGDEDLNEALELLRRFPQRHRGERPRALRWLQGRGFPLEVAFQAWELYEESRA